MNARAHPRDWPLPGHLWEVFIFLVLIALMSIATREALGAEPAARERPATGVASESVQASAGPAATSDGVDALFADLAAAEDPALRDHVAAGDLTTTELVLVIIFLILLFPVGIILLIVFLLDDD